MQLQVWAKWRYGHCSPGMDSSTAGLSQVLWQEEAELIIWQSTDVTQAVCRQVGSCNRERTQKGHVLLLCLVSPLSILTGPLRIERSQEHCPIGELSLQGHTILPISMATRLSPIWFLPYSTRKTSLPYLSHSNLLSHPQIYQILTAFMYLYLFFSLPAKGPSHPWMLFILNVSDQMACPQRWKQDSRWNIRNVSKSISNNYSYWKEI